MNKFNFKQEIEEVENKLKKEYQKSVETFIEEMFENVLTLQELKSIKIEDTHFKNFKLTKKNNSLLLKLEYGLIELTYALKNSKKVKRTEKDYELTPIEENSLLDVCYIYNQKTLIYTSEKKEMHLNKENEKALYSPSLENWTYTKKITDDFYDKYIYINYPIPQFHFIKENEDKSLYKAIYISQNDHFGLEYFKNKEQENGSLIENFYLCDKGLIKKR